MEQGFFATGDVVAVNVTCITEGVTSDCRRVWATVIEYLQAMKLIAVGHPDCRPLLEENAEHVSSQCHQRTPHDLTTAFDFHTNLAEHGSMKAEVWVG